MACPVVAGYAAREESRGGQETNHAIFARHLALTGSLHGRIGFNDSPPAAGTTPNRLGHMATC